MTIIIDRDYHIHYKSDFPRPDLGEFQVGDLVCLFGYWFRIIFIYVGANRGITYECQWTYSTRAQ